RDDCQDPIELLVGVPADGRYRKEGGFCSLLGILFTEFCRHGRSTTPKETRSWVYHFRFRRGVPAQSYARPKLTLEMQRLIGRGFHRITRKISRRHYVRTN